MERLISRTYNRFQISFALKTKHLASPGERSGKGVRLLRFGNWVQIPHKTEMLVLPEISLRGNIRGNDGYPLSAPLQMAIRFGDPPEKGNNAKATGGEKNCLHLSTYLSTINSVKNFSFKNVL